MDKELKILIVCSGNSSVLSPFIKEQSESLISQGLQLDYFLIKGKGLRGYARHYYKLRKKIESKKYNLIHAHYGLSGLLATLQRRVPVVVTFHGTDIHSSKNNLCSTIASLLADWRIFVSSNLYNRIYIKPKQRYNIIPCGIDLNSFNVIPQNEARESLGLDVNKDYVLFSSSFQRKIKNSGLAFQALENSSNSVLIELKNKTRSAVNLLLNACDALLLTSFNEGSPQIIKEAMACNCPIISTDVGDVMEVIRDTKSCYIVPYDSSVIKERLQTILMNKEKTNGREKVMHLGLNEISNRLITIYKKIVP